MIKEQDTNILVALFARQLGKSFTARLLALEWMSVPNTTIGYLTPTNRLGKEMYRKILKLYPKRLVKKSNGSDLIIELSNGSRILFVSIESIETLRGFTLDYLIWDECAFSREYTPDGQHIYYNIVSPTLDVRGKKQLFISTPNGTFKNLFYETYCKALRGEKGFKFFRCTIHEDETKTKEWIDQKRKTLPDKVWRQEYECEFLDEGISYFSGFEKKFTKYDFDWSVKTWLGIDFHSVGVDETIITFVNAKGQTKQFKAEGGLDEQYAKIANVVNSHSSTLVLGYLESNSIGEVMANEVLKKIRGSVRDKLKLRNTNNTNKNDDINALAYEIESGDLVFDSENYELEEQMKVFVAKKTKSGLSTFSAMDGYHDDRIMSLSFATTARRDQSGTKEYVKIIRR